MIEEEPTAQEEGIPDPAAEEAPDGGDILKSLCRARNT